jgi:hypothetical protein
MKVAVAKPYVFGPYEDFVTFRRVEQELSEYKALAWILQYCCHDWGVHPISFVSCCSARVCGSPLAFAGAGPSSANADASVKEGPATCPELIQPRGLIGLPVIPCEPRGGHQREVGPEVSRLPVGLYCGGVDGL